MANLWRNRMMKTYTPEELKHILEQHELWLDTGGEEGQKADLCNANLEDTDLSKADLRYANLRDANLRNAKLSCANF